MNKNERWFLQVVVALSLAGACSVPAWEAVKKRAAAPAASPTPSPHLLWLRAGASNHDSSSPNFQELSIGDAYLSHPIGTTHLSKVRTLEFPWETGPPNGTVVITSLVWTAPVVSASVTISSTFGAARCECSIHHDGTVEWTGLDPGDVAAVESAARRLENSGGYDGVIRALARLWRLEHGGH